MEPPDLDLGMGLGVSHFQSRLLITVDALSVQRPKGIQTCPDLPCHFPFRPPGRRVTTTLHLWRASERHPSPDCALLSWRGGHRTGPLLAGRPFDLPEDRHEPAVHVRFEDLPLAHV
jgi:hypothetical protein